MKKFQNTDPQSGHSDYEYKFKLKTKQKVN